MAASAIANRYAVEVNTRFSLGNSVSTQTGLPGSRARASRMRQPLESTHGTPVGPAAAFRPWPARIPGHSPGITVTPAGAVSRVVRPRFRISELRGEFGAIRTQLTGESFTRSSADG